MAIDTDSRRVSAGTAVDRPAALSTLVGPANGIVTAARATAGVIGVVRPETPSSSPLIKVFA